MSLNIEKRAYLNSLHARKYSNKDFIIRKEQKTTQSVDFDPLISELGVAVSLNDIESVFTTLSSMNYHLSEESVQSHSISAFEVINFSLLVDFVFEANDTELEFALIDFLENLSRFSQDLAIKIVESNCLKHIICNFNAKKQDYNSVEPLLPVFQLYIQYSTNVSLFIPLFVLLSDVIDNSSSTSALESSLRLIQQILSLKLSEMDESILNNLCQILVSLTMKAALSKVDQMLVRPICECIKELSDTGIDSILVTRLHSRLCVLASAVSLQSAPYVFDILACICCHSDSRVVQEIASFLDPQFIGFCFESDANVGSLCDLVLHIYPYIQDFDVVMRRDRLLERLCYHIMSDPVADKYTCMNLLVNLQPCTHELLDGKPDEIASIAEDLLQSTDSQEQEYILQQVIALLS